MAVRSAKVDRASLIRRATVELVAENGLHGTSMTAIAERAGVATGTAYVHYDSKAELLAAAYAEQKAALGSAAAAVELAGDPALQFQQIWHSVYEHLSADPVVAQFLLQVDASPIGRQMHAAAEDTAGDELVAAAEDLIDHLIDLPLSVLYDLAIGPAIRLVAAGQQLDDSELRRTAAAAWRAVAKP